MVLSKPDFSYNLFVTSFQVPVVPLQRPDDMYSSSHSWMQTAPAYEDMCNEQGIPTMITWSYDGKEVAVEGSWDTWRTRFQKLSAFLFQSLNSACAS
jgi:5'-AMP-activated protein kinase regulatory beta subunit